MHDFSKGQTVLIKCADVQPGPFNERLVLISAEPTNLSGFVDKKFLVERGATYYITGTVLGSSAGEINVRLPGSFFTSAAGVASVSHEWAVRNVEAA